MPISLSDTQANMLERAQTDLAKLLAELRDLHNALRPDAENDRDHQVLEYVHDAFNIVYHAHSDLRNLQESFSQNTDS